MSNTRSSSGKKINIYPLMSIAPNAALSSASLSLLCSGIGKNSLILSITIHLKEELRELFKMLEAS